MPRWVVKWIIPKSAKRVLRPRRHICSKKPESNVMRTVVYNAAVVALSIGLISTAGLSRADTAADLTPDRARIIVAPLYEALNEPSKKDVTSLLKEATTADYQSCSSNDECIDRVRVAAGFKYLGEVIPDLHWTIKEVLTSGDRIVVRGEAVGTPVLEFFGVKPTGRSFRIMSVDTFTVKDGKLSKAYHIENWTAAMKQIGDY
jgi:predicted ester cyclase